MSCQGSREPLRAVNVLVETLRARYGTAIQAVLFYGSCYRTGDEQDGLVDLYVLVDGYCSLCRRWSERWMYQILHPTVYYLEVPFDGRLVRCKYAVLSLADFQRGTSMRWFHSYLWGRFSQPAQLVYALDDRVAEQVYKTLGQAIVTFILRVVPEVPPSFDAKDLWQKGLSLSYQAELRAERPADAARLFEADPEYYEAVTGASIETMPFRIEVIRSPEGVQYHASISAWRRRVSHVAWSVRQIQGKLLSLLRLLKGLYTFRNGLDYVLWKIQRHSGITVEITPHVRRHPLLGAPALLWRLYRQGAFR